MNRTIHFLSTSRTALILLLATLLNAATAQGAWAWDGSGTAESPYQIKSTADLDQLATDVNSGTEHEGDYFVLTTDLTYSHETDWNDANSTENNYTPIGSYNNNSFRYFKGHFDGQSHTISGIRIYQSGDETEKRYAALFGQLSNGAEVKNVFLADARFTGYYYCGPIVGYNSGSVSNCHVLSDVTIHTVTPDAHFHGGVVGYNTSSGTITGCTSAASITAAVRCKYNGGITGHGSGTVEDCIYFGSTVAGDKYVGAIIGYASSGSTVRNCYYINDGIASATGYKTSDATVTDVRLATSDDFAVSGDTYTIGTAAGWSVMCAALYHNDTYNRFSGKTVQLGDDITVTRMAGSSNQEFAGTFDGGGYTLTVNITGTVQGTAPFCEIKGATIRNLVVTGSVAGKRHSAGLVGFARGDDASVENTIENCLVATNVCIMGDDNGYLGGIVGHGLKCKLTIRGCAFTGSLTSESNYTGGLQGWSDGNTLILEDDIFAASSVNAANVGFHPIAIHVNNASTTATVSNVYYTIAPTCTTSTRIAAAGKQAHTVAAGENVTLALSGTATEYGVSDITVYEGNHGIKFGTTYYAGSDDQLSLTLTTSAQCDQPGYQYTYTASAGTLSGSTLTMPDQDVTISVNTAALAPIDWATVNQGNSADPYMIYNKDQLQLLAHRVNGTNGETANTYQGKYFKLGADITFDHPVAEPDDYAENYEAIGGNIGGTYRYFRGTFDGDGHTVSGIRINKTGSSTADIYQGLFGQIDSGADIHDVHLTDARIKGYYNVGGIAGYTYGTVSGCSVTDSYITTTLNLYYGTICGENDGTLTNNYYHGCTVNGTPVTSGKGCQGADIAANNGALPAYRLALGANITTPPGTFVGDGESFATPPVGARLAPGNGFTLAGNHYFASGYVFTPGSTLASGAAQGYTPRATLDDVLLDLYTPTGDTDPLAGKAIARLTITADCDGKTLSAAIRSDGLQHEVSYMTADGTTQTAQAIALDGHETVDGAGDVHLAAGTYYVGTDIAYANQITPDGDVTLILANGKTMTLASDVTGIDGEYNLTIYGQSLDAVTAGTLRYNGTMDGISAYNYEQHSGNVSITTTTNGESGYWVYGIYANVTLRGGTLTISANGNKSCAIIDTRHSILGGQLTATATGTDATGIYASAKNGTAITLGWIRPADRITASSISAPYGGTVAVADGQALTDGSGNIYTGTLTDEQKEALAGKTLQPCLALADAADNTAAITDHAGKTLAVALSGRTLYKDGSWNTLCLPFAVDLTASGTLSGDNVQAMTLNTTTSSLADGTLTLNFDAATTIPAGTPFIIKWDESGTDITNPVFEGVTVSDATNDATVEGVLTFTGTYAPVSIAAAGDNTKLYLGAANKLYYPTKAMTIGTHRAYFQLLGDLTAGNSAGGNEHGDDVEDLVRAFVLNFGDDESTGIKNGQWSMDNGQSETWYTLDGRRLDGQPTAKGLYINKGKKVAIK